MLFVVRVDGMKMSPGVTFSEVSTMIMAFEAEPSVWTALSSNISFLKPLASTLITARNFQMPCCASAQVMRHKTIVDFST